MGEVDDTSDALVVATEPDGCLTPLGWSADGRLLLERSTPSTGPGTSTLETVAIDGSARSVR